MPICTNEPGCRPGVSLPVVADVGTDLQERDLRRHEGVVASTSTPVVRLLISALMSSLTCFGPIRPGSSCPDPSPQGRCPVPPCPVTAQIARSSSLTCTEETSLTIHGGQRARFARFK